MITVRDAYDVETIYNDGKFAVAYSDVSEYYTFYSFEGTFWSKMLAISADEIESVMNILHYLQDN